MIVRMSKVEVIGPKDLLLPVLALIRQLGVLQIEEDMQAFPENQAGQKLKSLLLDRQTLAERLFFEDLKQKIDTLMACFPPAAVREAYLDPRTALEALSRLVEQHGATCRGRQQRLATLTRERERLEHLVAFLQALEPLLRGAGKEIGLEFIGIEIRDPADIEPLTRTLHRLTEGRFEMQTTVGPEGRQIGLITIEREMAAQLKKGLRQDQLPELGLPAGMEDLPFAEKIVAAGRHLDDIREQIDRLEKEQQNFARRWLAIYRKVRAWLDDRLALLNKTTALLQTEMCFYILGWLPTSALNGLRRKLTDRFEGRVVVEEKEILVQDSERIPVATKNPAYFRPFELLTRLLPLPRYGTFDPTPFLGLFFPLFFGMILGDIGYGLILLTTALGLIFIVRKPPALVDAGKILGVCALYTIFFGWIFGEFFGELGQRVLGLEPVGIDRRSAILPMFYFSISVGFFHIMLGMLLGFVSAMKRGERKEALYKLLSILAVFVLVALLASWFMPALTPVRVPLLTTTGVALVLLLATGGLLAPLELLKTFGNIISYARIMAVGLASVLLAYVANRLAGEAGSILVGILAAIVLHAFNILLGVFAPTIHALRLHYVEFFGKFIEHGGRRFEPLEKK